MKNIVITGANRGIGLALTQHYLKNGHTVFACCRKTEDFPLGKIADTSRLNLVQLDITQSSDIANLVSELAQTPVDIIIQNAGIYGPKGQPLGQIDAAAWEQVLVTNTIAPIKFIEALYPSLFDGQDKIIAVLSSKMGSMGDNGSGGSYIYRSSKAALNAAVKSLSIDLANYGISVAALHPGWVQTDMGGANALISANESVQGLTQIIDNINADNSGGFFNFNGDLIPW